MNVVRSSSSTRSSATSACLRPARIARSHRVIVSLSTVYFADETNRDQYNRHTPLYRLLLGDQAIKVSLLKNCRNGLSCSCICRTDLKWKSTIRPNMRTLTGGIVVLLAALLASLNSILADQPPPCNWQCQLCGRGQIACCPNNATVRFPDFSPIGGSD